MGAITCLIGSSPILTFKEFEKVNNLVTHRGPDGDGYLVDHNTYHREVNVNSESVKQFKCEMDLSIMLGNRRMTFHDGYEDAPQPYKKRDEDCWVILDGEIYNINDIKEELGLSCDITTIETIIISYRKWGHSVFQKFNGQWSLLILDLAAKKIICARDRFGIKPLYYYYNGKCLMVASEIKQILFSKINSFTLCKSVVYNFVASVDSDIGSETLYNRVKRVLPSEYLVFSMNDFSLSPQKYWDFDTNYLKSNCREKDLVEEFNHLFEKAIKRRLPNNLSYFGCALSGGLDSSSIVCKLNDILRDNLKDKYALKTLSIRFDEDEYDDAIYKKSVIDAVNAESIDFTMTDQNLFEDLGKILWHQDEPIPSSGEYGRWLLYRLCRKNNLKVIIEGNGSDELLGGYDWYTFAFFIAKMKKLNVVSAAKELIYFQKNHSLYSELLRPLLHCAKDFIMPNTKQDNVASLSDIFTYRMKPDNLGQIQDFGTNGSLKFPDYYQKFMYTHLKIKGATFINRLNDRNAMSSSIIQRVPFFDNDLVQFLFSVPSEYKFRRGRNKYLLREAGRKYLPDIVRTRISKRGLETPENDWMKKPVNSQRMEEIFSVKSNYINTAELKKKLNGEHDLLLWRCMNILYFEKRLENEVLF